MMKRFAFKPKELKAACETEPWSHKAKIVGFACIMSGISSYYQYYFDMLIYRSNQFQMAALAGEEGYDFLDYSWNSEWTAEMWSLRQTMDVYKEKGLKELKQIQKDWKTGSYDDAGNTVYTNPNGNPKDDEGYYTPERRFYDDWSNKYNEIWDDHFKDNKIEQDAEQYSNWADMHEGVQWFDTAACWKGKFIGDVNSVVITPDTSVNQQFETDLRNPPTLPTAASDADPSVNARADAAGNTFGTFWGGWYTGANYSNQSPSTGKDKNDKYNKLVAPKDANGPYQAKWKEQTVTNSAGQSVTVYTKETVFRNNAWDVDVKVDGRIDWADGQLTEDLVNAKIELAEDCDMDCQKRGSAMTVVAILMRTAYGIIALNALFMFIGAWRYRARVCSIYCTFVSCLCQFILQIVAATMMFTKYNNVCMRSMTNTFVGFRWTMNDDFQMTFNLWVAGLILMLPFVCCGMCSAYVASN